MSEQSIRERVREIVQQQGVRAAESATGLPAETVLRLAAGAGVRRGTLVLAAQNLERQSGVGRR